MPLPPPAAHILCFARTLDGGGVERALLRLARGWTAAGRRVTLVVGDASGPLAAELAPAIELVELGDRRGRALLRLPGIVADLAPDLLFCPGNYYSSTALWTRARLGRRCPPIVLKMSNAVTRGDHGRLSDLGHHAWLGLHGRFLDHLVAMTPGTAAIAAAALGMEGRTSVIANPPAIPHPELPQTPLPTGPVVLGVGRLVAQKRWDRLIDALPRLADASAQLVILGEGALREALAAQAARLGVADRVHLPGHAPDPLGAMARAQVVALPSDFEGVPGVLREALSVGTPVVATDSSPAVAEIVAGPALGDVVRRDDPDALVAALDRWLAPGVTRPLPVPAPGADAAARYLRLFDTLVARRS
jgi:glycosyltransferase involved in cell wall biosynthesis